VRGLPGPRKPARKPRNVPTLEEWLEIGRRAWQIPGPLGAAVWLVLYSGMRIGDVLDVSPGEIQEAIGRGSTSCHQKGRGGKRRRSWTPGPLCRIALDRLAEEGTGWQHLWQILGTVSKHGAEDRINKAIPKPYTAHCFRHATPTYLVALGMDLPTIATITGHESLSSLEKYIRTSIAVPASRTYDAQAKLMNAILSAGYPKKPDT
jgi:integrase